VALASVTVRNVFYNGITFNDDNAAKITDSRVEGVGAVGISFANYNDFTISGTTISDVCCSGIAFQSWNTGVITNTTIADSHNFGIMFVDNNDVTISGVTIRDVGSNGLQIFGPDNTVQLANTTFSGTIGNDVIAIDDFPNTLSGTGNVFDGTAGGLLCNAAPGQIGQFTFVSPAATCP
jgi:hypothetical protein